MHRSIAKVILGVTSMMVLAFGQQAAGPADRQTGRGPFYVPGDHRPKLFYREDFQAPPNSHGKPLTQAYIANPNLELKQYGAGNDVEISHHEEPKDDPISIWTGLTHSSWAIAFREKNNYVNLTGLAKIRWRTSETGFHELRPILKLASGMWLIGEHAVGWTPDWHESEFWPAWIRWRRLDINNVLEEPTGTPFETGRWELSPDLSRVDEIGFTDLTAGTGHGQGGASNIDWIEIYGNPAPRESRKGQ